MTNESERSYLRQVIEHAIETGQDEVVSRRLLSALELEELALEEIDEQGWGSKVNVRVSDDEYSLVVEPIAGGLGANEAHEYTK